MAARSHSLAVSRRSRSPTPPERRRFDILVHDHLQRSEVLTATVADQRDDGPQDAPRALRRDEVAESTHPILVVDDAAEEGARWVRPRDVTRVVVTQALFAVVVLTAINAMHHHQGLVTIGEVIAAGLGGILAAMLFAGER